MFSRRGRRTATRREQSAKFGRAVATSGVFALVRLLIFLSNCRRPEGSAMFAPTRPRNGPGPRWGARSDLIHAIYLVQARGLSGL
jgi:hypothetical protein